MQFQAFWLQVVIFLVRFVEDWVLLVVLFGFQVLVAQSLDSLLNRTIIYARSTIAVLTVLLVRHHIIVIVIIIQQSLPVLVRVDMLQSLPLRKKLRLLDNVQLIIINWTHADRQLQIIFVNQSHEIVCIHRPHLPVEKLRVV